MTCNHNHAMYSTCDECVKDLRAAVSNAEKRVAELDAIIPDKLDLSDHRASTGEREEVNEQERFARLVEKVGKDLYSRNAIVHAAMHTILCGSSDEDALIAAVRALVESNDQIFDVAVRHLGKCAHPPPRCH